MNEFEWAVQRKVYTYSTWDKPWTLEVITRGFGSRPFTREEAIDYVTIRNAGPLGPNYCRVVRRPVSPWEPL